MGKNLLKNAIAQLNEKVILQILAHKLNNNDFNILRVFFSMITLILDTRINLTLSNEDIKHKISKESTQIVHLL